MNLKSFFRFQLSGKLFKSSRIWLSSETYDIYTKKYNSNFYLHTFINDITGM